MMCITRQFTVNAAPLVKKMKLKMLRMNALKHASVLHDLSVGTAVKNGSLCLFKSFPRTCACLCSFEILQCVLNYDGFKGIQTK